METLPTALILPYISKLQDFLFLFGCREWFATVEGTALSRDYGTGQHKGLFGPSRQQDITMHHFYLPRVRHSNCSVNYICGVWPSIYMVRGIQDTTVPVSLIDESENDHKPRMRG
jgi:hypothetical protein